MVTRRFTRSPAGFLLNVAVSLRIGGINSGPSEVEERSWRMPAKHYAYAASSTVGQGEIRRLIKDNIDSMRSTQDLGGPRPQPIRQRPGGYESDCPIQPPRSAVRHHDLDRRPHASLDALRHSRGNPQHRLQRLLLDCGLFRLEET